MRRGLPPLLLLSLLIWGCADLEIRRTAHPPPAPRITIPSENARGFADVIVAIVQPGDNYSSLARKYLGDPSMDWFLSEFNGKNLPAPGQDVLIPLASYAPGGLWPTGYQTVPVLTYHKLSRGTPDTMTVREADFEAQMRFLRENGYRVIPSTTCSNFSSSAARSRTGPSSSRSTTGGVPCTTSSGPS
ncbi:MAG TPA: hypothetical protein VIJ89_06730 [Deferrimonas sp.]